MRTRVQNYFDEGHYLYLVTTLFVSLLIILTSPGATQAQTTPITSSGLNTQVNLSSSPPAGKIQYDITGGTRPGNGPNLFHSFGDFNVPTNNIANFFNDSGLATSNILGRVTNGNPSSIFGTVQTTGFGNANLFLMNPSGIVFGPNATLNVGGSVNFTTTNYIRLFDGVNSANFYANPASDSLANSILAVPPLANFGFVNASPAAYGFIDGTAASITIQGGTLEVPSGSTLSFIGGPASFTPPGGNPVSSGVTMTGGSLSASNGLVYLATATEAGEIPLPNLSGTPLGNLGPASGTDAIIRIRSGEFVMDHAFLTASNTTVTNRPPIDINVQGAMTLRNASSISSDTSGAGRGSNIQVTAQSLELDRSSITSSTTGDGAGGSISIMGGSISLTNGAQIVSRTGGAGTGGDITLAATDTLSISGYDATGSLTGVVNILLVDQNTGLPAVASGIFSLTSSTGNGGQVYLSAPTAAVTLQNGGTLSTIASGDGRGGNIAVESRTMTLSDGGQITSFNGADLILGELTGGTGPAGNITVSAQDFLAVSGYNADLAISSSISSQTFGSVKGGDITATAHIMTLENGGQLVAGTFADGLSGNISVSAPGNLLISGFNLSNSSQIQTTTGSTSVTAGSATITSQASLGAGGDIAFQIQNDLNVTAAGSISTSGGAIGINADQVLVSGHTGPSRSQIASLSTGDNAAGDITLNVRNLRVEDRGLIRSESSGAGQNAGITVTAESVTVADLGEISMLNGQGPGGLLEIRATNIALNQGVLSTTASGAGDAGAISLVAGNVSLDNSRISSATNGGTARGGDVTITATNGVTITGLFTDESGLTSPSGILTRTFAAGDAGNVIINAERLNISGGAQINSRSLSSGHAGNITIQGEASPAESIVITGPGSSILTETSRTGTGGDVTMWSSELRLTNGATISAKTTGQMPNAGNAGNILVKADDITISGGASITAASTGKGKAGTVTIQGTQSPAQSLLITGTGSGLFSNTSGTGTGGNILVVADEVELTNGGTLSAKTTGTASTATGGTITVRGDDVRVESGGTMTASSSGPGKAGNILIEGTASPAESIRIDGTGSGLFTETSGTGAGGDITTWSEQLRLTNGSTISAKTTGQMPNAGDGGNILIKADDITISGGATITAASTGTGNAGTVTIQGAHSPARSLLITGAGSGVFSNTSGTGAGGDLMVISESVRLADGGTLSAATSGTDASAVGGTIGILAENVRIENGVLTASSTGQGEGGSIGVLAAGTFESHAGTISTAASRADAGDIGIFAGQSVTLNTGTSISTRSTGPGHAGDIFIDAGQLFEMHHSAVTAEAAQAAGGSIDIRALDRVKLEQSLISTSVLGGEGSGGNIFIDPNLTTLKASQILAQAVLGNGGNITLVTRLFFADPFSRIDASSQFGLNGLVQIQSPTSNLAGTLGTLPSSLRQTPNLQTGRCAALANSQSSSFLIAGRDAIPTEPGGWQPSPLVVGGDGIGLAARGAGTERLAMAPSPATAGDTVSLRRLTPAGFLTQSFAEGGSTGCRA